MSFKESRNSNMTKLEERKLQMCDVVRVGVQNIGFCFRVSQCSKHE